MRSVLFACIAALAVTACAGPGGMRATATRGDLGEYRAFSWGKPDVTYDEYVTTAFECTARGALQADAPPSEHDYDKSVGVPVDVDRVMDIRYAVGDPAAEQNASHQRYRQIVVDTCLEEFGFQRFGLNEEQIAVLSTLRRGTPERRAYLHRLGSNPDVLAAQHL